MSCPRCDRLTPDAGRYRCQCRGLPATTRENPLVGNTRLLVVTSVAVVVILLGAVFVANMRAATNRGRIKQTMSEIRTAGTAWASAREDGDTWCPPGWRLGSFEWGNLPPRALARHLEPRYVVKFPTIDAWGRPYEFAVQCSSGRVERYGIRSRGPDGQWATELFRRGGIGFDHDIVLMDGRFVSEDLYEQYIAQ